MSERALSFDAIEALLGGKIGVFDTSCPLCGPGRRSVANQRRRVLRIWRLQSDFASYRCARCGERGYARDGATPRPHRLSNSDLVVSKALSDLPTDRIAKARWLWSKRQPIGGSIAERYLRDARGYGGAALPPTLAFLPPRGAHGPAMIAAFGVPEEPTPGELSVGTVRGVHITRLAADGSGKAGTDKDKIVVGSVSGMPIVLAPVNDLCGLAITEGIEDGLSVLEAAGLGVWVAGAASFMPALAEQVPAYVESAIIFSHNDAAGQAGALALAHLLQARGCEVFVENLQ